MKSFWDTQSGFSPIFLLVLGLLSLGLFISGFTLGQSQAPTKASNINPTEDELSENYAEPLLKEQDVKGVQNATLPPPGYSVRKVTVDGLTYTINIVAADLNSTRVIVDTASDSDCRDNCPVLSLKDYVQRNGAYAGINGAYFCPAAYPSCAGKKNSFDTLLMNKNKRYFNSDNNVYSTVPAVIFQGNSVRFVSQSLEWGRDTGIDSMTANYPLLVLNGQVIFGGSGDGKLNGKGSRSFVGNKDNMIYIGIVQRASVAESAKALQALGMQNALNLDSGGSTALWSGGYKFGPGRALPNAILFQKK